MLIPWGDIAPAVKIRGRGAAILFALTTVTRVGFLTQMHKELIGTERTCWELTAVPRLLMRTFREKEQEESRRGVGYFFMFTL